MISSSAIVTHGHSITPGESTIGRDEDCDLSIDAVSLSRKHAVVLVEKGTHFVMDNSSRNRTFRKSVSASNVLALPKLLTCFVVLCLHVSGGVAAQCLL